MSAPLSIPVSVPISVPVVAIFAAVADRADVISRFIQAAAPFLIGVTGIFFLALPIRLFEGAIPTPILPLIVVYFWTIYDPEKMPAYLVFVLGLVQDALTGGPFGLWSAAYLAAQFIILSQRSYFLGRDPQVVWLGFAVTALGVGLAIWLLQSLMSGGLLPLVAIVFQIAVTILIYPLIGHGFRNIRHRVLQEA